MKHRKNLFSSLHRWAWRQDENFCSEGLVYILNHLLEAAPESAQWLVSKLLYQDGRMLPSSHLKVTTQLTDGSERPDIWIESPEILAIIEVKTWSGLGREQLQRYWELIQRRRGSREALLTYLTVVPAEIPPKISMHVLPRRWYQLADWLMELKDLPAETRFLVQEFTQFLAERAMTIERVPNSYIDGCRGLLYLHEMLLKAIEGAGQKAGSSGPWLNERGWRLSTGHWVGVSLLAPEIIYFSPDLTKTNGKLLQTEFNLGQAPWGHMAFAMNLSDEGIQFFEMSKDQQVECLCRFIKDSHRSTERFRVESSAGPVAEGPTPTSEGDCP